MNCCVCNQYPGKVSAPWNYTLKACRHCVPDSVLFYHEKTGGPQIPIQTFWFYVSELYRMGVLKEEKC